MRFRDILEIVWANWRANKLKLRLALSVIAISIGVVMLLLSLGFGSSNATIGRLSNHGSLTTIDVSRHDPNSAPMDKTTLDQLKQYKYIKSAVGTMDYPALIQYAKSAMQADLITAPQEYVDTDAPLLLRGTDQFSSQAAKEAIVSSKITGSLGFNKPTDAIGQKVKIQIIEPQYQDTNGYKVAVPSRSVKSSVVDIEIIGVVSESQYSIIYVPASLFKPDPQYYSIIRVGVENQALVGAMSRELQEFGFTTITYGDKMSDAHTIQIVFEVTMGIIAFFVLLVVSILGAQTMAISLLERAREVTLMKKIGMSIKAMRRMYRTEAILLVAFGCCIGIIGSYALGWVFNLVIYAGSRIVGGVYVELFYLPLLYIPLAFLISLAIGVIAGFFPARRVSNIQIAIDKSPGSSRARGINSIKEDGARRRDGAK